MTTWTPAKLAFIQLPDTKGDIYDPGSDMGQVHNILLHNSNTASEQVEIYLHDGTNEYLLYNYTMISDETVQLSFGSEGLVVDSASKLTGNAETASKVTCLVCGTVRA